MPINAAIEAIRLGARAARELRRIALIELEDILAVRCGTPRHVLICVDEELQLSLLILDDLGPISQRHLDV